MRREDEDDSTPNTPTVEADGGDEDVSRNINIDVPGPQFSKLSTTKEKYGFTWKGMLLYAHRSLRQSDDCSDE